MDGFLLGGGRATEVCMAPSLARGFRVPVTEWGGWVGVTSGMTGKGGTWEVRAYLADSSKQARLNPIRTWWIESTGEDCHYNRLKAIMITAFLS